MLSSRPILGLLRRGGVIWSRNYHDLQILERSLSKVFQNDKVLIEQSSVFNSIKSMIELQKISNSEDSSKIDKLFRKFIESPNVELTNDFITKIIKELDPSTKLIVELFQTYNARHPTSYIKLELAKLALRQSIYHKINLNDAMEIVNLTTGSKNYIEYVKTERNISIFKYLTVGALGIGLLDIGLRSMGLNPRIGVYAMCFSYVFNVFAFSVLSFGDRFIPIVDHIEFEKGTTINKRYLSSDQMRMLSKIAEVDSSLNGVEGFVSGNFSNNIATKGLIPTQPESDILMQEYWLTSGNNFEWIEPDQDPAEILWRLKVESQKPVLLNDLKWTDKLIEGDDSIEVCTTALKEA